MRELERSERRAGGGEKSAPNKSIRLFVYSTAGAILQGKMNMGYEKIDYAAILADLEAKRTALDNAINSLKAVIASGIQIGVSDGASLINLSANVISPSASGGEVPDGAFHGKTLPAGIKLYLSLVNKKQTAREISDGLKKGGMESTSKWFDKIIHATLDRLRKAGEVVKIEGHWGLPEWYPALMRAGIGDTSQKPKRRGRPRKVSSNTKGQKLLPPALKEAKPKSGLPKIKGTKPEPGPSDLIDWFLRDTPGSHTSKEIQSATGIKNLKVTTMLLGQLVKKGKVKKAEDGKYFKAQ